MEDRVYVYRPYIPEIALKYIEDVLESGCIAGTCRRYVKMFEEKLAEYLGIKNVIACSSGTAALHTCIESLDIGPGDVVLVPGFTFVASASCVLHANAIPVFVDIELDTFGIDPVDLENVLKKCDRARAVVLVHIGGVPADIENVLKICEEHDLTLIEDCAQALGAEHNGKKLGTFGKVATFSFYPTKTITTGEGGAIATNDDEVANRCRMIINHGEIERYNYVRLGYNYRMSEIEAALGLAQLERIEYYVDTRQRFVNAFISEIRRYLDDNIIKLPNVRSGSKPCWNLVEILINFEKIGKSRDWLISELHKAGLKIFTVAYPKPLNTTPLFAEVYGRGRECPLKCCNIDDSLLKRRLPNCEYACSHVITMLVPPGLTEDDGYEVAERFIKVLKKAYSNL